MIKIIILDGSYSHSDAYEVLQSDSGKHHDPPYYVDCEWRRKNGTWVDFSERNNAIIAKGQNVSIYVQEVFKGNVDYDAKESYLIDMISGSKYLVAKKESVAVEDLKAQSPGVALADADLSEMKELKLLQASQVVRSTCRPFSKSVPHLPTDENC